jgi:PAS domain S-box-containing protein
MKGFRCGAVTVALLASLLVAAPAPAAPTGVAHAVAAPAQVLLLQSYHEGFAWSDNVTRGVKRVLEAADRPIELSVQYMDTKRRNDEEHYANLLRLYGHMFPPGLFRAVIAVDDDALIFALRNRDVLFPGVPIVFCGFSHDPGELTAGRRGVTGIVETQDTEETIRLAIELHPKTRRVVAINDRTTTGLSRQKQLDEVAAALGVRGVAVETLADVTAEQLERRLGELKDTDVVFLQMFNRDSAGRVFNPEGLMALIAGACARPVYTVKEEYLGLGVVGGFLAAGEVHGAAAARMALRILGGEDPAAIPPVLKSINPPMFDDRQLRRFGIDPGRLPSGSVRTHAHVPFYVQHATVVAGTAAAFLALVAVIGVLTASVRTRRRAEEDLATTLQSIGDAVVATDRQGRVLRVNPVAERLTGWPAAEAVGRPLEEIFRTLDSRTRAPAPVPLEAVVARGETRSLAESTLLVARGGAEIRIGDSISPIRSPDGAIRGAVLVFRDVTEQEALEEHLRQAQKMETVGRLAGGVAHDFNNLLGGITGYADLLIVGLAGNERLRGYAERIVETAARAAGLTRNLLAFSRKNRLSAVEIDVHRSIRDVLGILEQTIDRRIVIRTRFAPGSPVVTGDLSQLQSALLNLGVNARDAMPDGGTLTIATAEIVLDDAAGRALPEHLPAGRYVEITLSDSGVGMPPEVMAHLFEPFFSTKPAGRGTGLGLAAVYGTVRAHRGAITVQSAPGAGATFRILLPAGVAGAAGASVPAPAARFGSGCILVVDDEKIIRSLVTEMLHTLGYEVLLAEDGDEAVEVFRRERDRISLVILDVIMPKRNGPETYRALRAIDPGVRVLIASGFDFDTASRTLVTEGVAGFLQKPFRFSELSKKIADTLKDAPAA